MIKETEVKTVSDVLLKLWSKRRFKVHEITLDMTSNMNQIARICFSGAKQVVNRFHVQQLTFEAVQ